ncbi:uncharacterized protein LOC123713924 [Pieris brassicae]|uniref:Uncharacterized protein n=1 Tax=Pieris brassicae TaxID=7116 RepID=A0A9P0T6B5_PIEBR|nr:uncharacterized protein LOC123713924 [Pieris brassicae]CAH3981176.1 unnamed protein product [Pieris brassicae]
MSTTNLIKILFVLFLAEVTTITVKPCPTNKIAPHSRYPRYSQQSRTFGHIFSLFADENQENHGGLQDDAQNEPNECGDVEDYDENDLSTVTRNQKKRDKERLFFNPLGFLFGHSRHPTEAPTKRPVKSSYQPTRPPPGGYFGTNPYRPPMRFSPSDHLKPVQEYDQEPQILYKPGLVGAPLGHVVGVHQVKPRRQSLQNRDSKSLTTEPTKHQPKNPKPRNIQDTDVIRSFMDLIF